MNIQLIKHWLYDCMWPLMLSIIRIICEAVRMYKRRRFHGFYLLCFVLVESWLASGPLAFCLSYLFTFTMNDCRGERMAPMEPHLSRPLAVTSLLCVLCNFC